MVTSRLGVNFAKVVMTFGECMSTVNRWVFFLILTMILSYEILSVEARAHTVSVR